MRRNYRFFRKSTNEHTYFHEIAPAKSPFASPYHYIKESQDKDKLHLSRGRSRDIKLWKTWIFCQKILKIIAILEQGPTYNYVAHLYFIVPRNRLSQITSRQIVLVRKYSNRCYKPYRIAGISKDFVINRNCIDILKFHNQDQTLFYFPFPLIKASEF